MIRLTCFIFAVSALLIATFGCSNGHNPIAPKDASDNVPIPALETGDSGTNHSLLGRGTIHFDLENLTASVEINREAEGHYNITTMAPMDFSVQGYDPVTMIVDVGINIVNPYPLDGRDVRLIIYHDAIGHKLINSDSWTDLYDIPAGLPINPFKMYSAYAPGHIFEGESQDKQDCQIYLPGGNPFVEYAIDVSYPTNCEEPYKITNFVQDTILYDQAGSATHIEVDVYDWQHDINDVSLYCPAITGVTLLPFTEKMSFVWEMDLFNSTGASSGDYAGVVVALSTGSGCLAMYNFVNITVTPETHDDGWAGTWGNSYEDIVNDVAYSGQELIYVVGSFMGIVDFDPSTSVYEIESHGDEDAYLSIFYPDGNLMAAFGWGGEWEAEAYSVAVTPNKETYVVGLFRGRADFDPGPGEFLMESNGLGDAFLSKFGPENELEWSVSWGDDELDLAFCVAVDDSSSAYVGGTFDGTVDFDPGPDVVEYSSGTGRASFVSKFDRSGNFIWAAVWEADQCRDINILDNKNIFLTGSFDYTVDFDPGTGYEPRTSVNNSHDVYLTSFSSDGKFQDVKTWGGTHLDTGIKVAVYEDSFVYVAGLFSTTVDFNPDAGVDEHTSNGMTDVFLSLFDSSLDYKWAQTWGGISSDKSYGLCIDTSGNIYVTGFFSDEVDLDPSANTDTHISNGSGDIFLSKFSNSGKFVWGLSWGGTMLDMGCGVAAESDDYLDLVGSFHETVDFDPGIPVDEHTAIGQEDIFLTRLTTDGEW